TSARSSQKNIEEKVERKFAQNIPPAKVKRFSAAATARLQNRLQKRSLSSTETDNEDSKSSAPDEPSVARHTGPSARGQNPPPGHSSSNGQSPPSRQWGSGGGVFPTKSPSTNLKLPGQNGNGHQIPGRPPTANPSAGPEVNPTTNFGRLDDWNRNGVPNWPSNPNWFGTGVGPTQDTGNRDETQRPDNGKGDQNFGNGDGSNTQPTGSSADSRLSNYNYYDQYSQTWHRFYNPSNFNGSFGGPGMNRNNTNWNRWFNLWAYGPNFWGDTDDMDLYGGLSFGGPAGPSMDGLGSGWPNGMWNNFDDRNSWLGGDGMGYGGPGNWWDRSNVGLGGFGDNWQDGSMNNWWQGYGNRYSSMPDGGMWSPDQWADDCDNMGWDGSSSLGFQGPWNTQGWWNPSWQMQSGFGDQWRDDWCALCSSQRFPPRYGNAWQQWYRPSTQPFQSPRNWFGDGSWHRNIPRRYVGPWQYRVQYAGRLGDPYGGGWSRDGFRADNWRGGFGRSQWPGGFSYPRQSYSGRGVFPWRGNSYYRQPSGSSIYSGPMQQQYPQAPHTVFNPRMNQVNPV
ncbi:hypothetical protein BaRGS_00020565, partial [Batillaria attramentaria]